MIYLFIILLCGLPISSFLFNKIDIWHAQGMWFQVWLLVLFCASFCIEPYKVKIKNIPLGILTFWTGSLTLFFVYQGLLQDKYIVLQFLPFLNFLYILIFYGLCVQHLNTEKIHKILRYLAYMLLVTILYCVLQAFKLDPFFSALPNLFLSHLNRPAVVGFIGNPTHLSAYLGMMLPLFFLFRLRTAVLSIVLVFILTLFFTNFGSYAIPVSGILVAVITLLYYLFKRHRKAFIATVIILLITGCIFYLSLEGNAKAYLFDSQGRLEIWKMYFEKSKNTFVTGKGLGSINIISSQMEEYYKVYSRFRHLHNEYFHFLFELGLIGLLAILYCIWDFWKVKVKETKEVVIIKAVFLGFLIQALTLYPAHLWMNTSIGIFAYSCIYCLKNEEIK